jgi:hypothetical protein
MAEEPSPQYTITFGPGVMDVIARCVHHLNLTRGQEQTRFAARTNPDIHDLAADRDQMLTQYASFVNGLTSVLSSLRDGNVRISVDGYMSLFFRYDSGYHGGLIFHENRGGDPTRSSWSIHT